MIVVERKGENTIVVAPGANALFTADLMSALPAVLTPDAVLALQLEIPVASCLAAARHALDCGARVVLNAAPLPKVLDPAFGDLMATVDVLVVNEGEALRLSGRPQAPTDQADWAGWAELADGLRGLGPSGCVVTLGSHGAVCADARGRYVQPAFDVDAVDTTGAGDSFCGALAVALADGAPLREAVRRGCAAGALAATRMGAQSAMPAAAELDQFLRQSAPGGVVHE